VVSLDII